MLIALIIFGLVVYFMIYKLSRGASTSGYKELERKIFLETEDKIFFENCLYKKTDK